LPSQAELGKDEQNWTLRLTVFNLEYPTTQRIQKARMRNPEPRTEFKTYIDAPWDK
jgi:hypothetical protein